MVSEPSVQISIAYWSTPAGFQLLCHREIPCRDIFNRPIFDVVVDGKDVCEILMTEGYASPQKSIRACSRDKTDGPSDAISLDGRENA